MKLDKLCNAPPDEHGSSIIKQDLASEYPCSSVVTYPEIHNFQDTPLDHGREVKPENTRTTEIFSTTHRCDNYQLPQPLVMNHDHDYDSQMKGRLQPAYGIQLAQNHQLQPKVQENTHLQPIDSENNHNVKPVIAINAQQIEATQLNSDRRNMSETLQSIPSHPHKDKSNSKKRLGVQKVCTDAKLSWEQKNRVNHSLSLRNLQNMLLGLNPNLPESSKWSRLRDYNIYKDDSGIMPLTYRKDDIVTSATQFISLTNTHISNVIRAHQDRQEMIRGYMAAGADKKELFSLLVREFMSNDLVDGLEKLKKQGAVYKHPGRK